VEPRHIKDREECSQRGCSPQPTRRWRCTPQESEDIFQPTKNAANEDAAHEKVKTFASQRRMQPMRMQPMWRCCTLSTRA